LGRNSSASFAAAAGLKPLSTAPVDSGAVIRQRSSMTIEQIGPSKLPRFGHSWRVCQGGVDRADVIETVIILRRKRYPRSISGGAAQLMLKRYGERALEESAARADELGLAGDEDGATTWRRIEWRAIPSSPSFGHAIHIFDRDSMAVVSNLSARTDIPQLPRRLARTNAYQCRAFSSHLKRRDPTARSGGPGACQVQTVAPISLYRTTYIDFLPP
jgi:hypothetical protein